MSTTLSSLELMLVKIQQSEDQQKDAPPALPVRPVSRARLPRARKQLPFHFKFVESMHEPALAPIGVVENSKETAQKEILKIQKCYRGHQLRCYYSKLRRGAIALQSFVRGENSRKEHWYRIKRLRAIIVIQRHIREHFAYGAIEQRRAAVVRLQSGIRGWLSRRRFDNIVRAQKLKIENEIDKKDCVLVQHVVLVDLQKQTLRTEAKLRKKNEENSALNMQLQKMEGKWREYEERMKSMEKTWQDQLCYIQTCLAAAKKNPTDEITIQFDATSGHQNQKANDTATATGTGFYHGKSMVNSLDFPSSNGSGPHIITNSTSHIIEQMYDEDDDDDGDRDQVASDQVKLHPGVELRKLKLRFASWKKTSKLGYGKQKQQSRSSAILRQKKAIRDGGKEDK